MYCYFQFEQYINIQAKIKLLKRSHSMVTVSVQLTKTCQNFRTPLALELTPQERKMDLKLYTFQLKRTCHASLKQNGARFKYFKEVSVKFSRERLGV